LDQSFRGLLEDDSGQQLAFAMYLRPDDALARLAAALMRALSAAARGMMSETRQSWTAN
jgi:hypothetical protein